MAGIRVIMAAVAISSAVVSMSAGGQVGTSASLTHTVSVSVPPRLKVQVANLPFSGQAAASVSSVQPQAAGLSITVNATQAWVLSIGSGSRSAASKSRLQWSTETSGFSTVTAQDVAVASGASYDAKESNVFFRNASDRKFGGQEGEIVVLTVSAP
jgi:spore coat protein U-like protein